MNERFNQSSHPARTGDHPLPRRGDPNFSTSHPYSSSAHPHPQPQTHPNYTTLPGAYPQQMQPRHYDDPHNSSQYVSPNHSHRYPQQRHSAAGYSNREALQLPQMDSDLSGLTRDLQNVHVSSSPQPAQAVSPVTGHHSPPGRSIPRKPIHGDSEVPARHSSREHHPPSNHPLPVPPYTARDSNDLAASKRALPDLTGIVDLRNTADTDVREHIAPAVVHETLHRDVRRVREEKITREIHTHDVFHRIQPIIDVEVLPARHFVPAADGSLREVAEETLPGRVREKVRNWIVAETVSRIPSRTPVESLRAQPRQFTARTFTGTEGDFKRYVTADGVEHTETTWVHPPVLEEGARLTGQTVPIVFESEGALHGHKPHGRESHVDGHHHYSSHDRGVLGHGPRSHDSHGHRTHDHSAHSHGVSGHDTRSYDQYDSRGHNHNPHGYDSHSHGSHDHSMQNRGLRHQGAY